MRQGIIDNHARRILDHHRCLTPVITIMTMAMVTGIITNNLIPSAALQRLLTFCSPQMSISILVSNNNNTYTLHRPYPLQLRNQIVLVYFQPPPLPILTFHSHHPTTISVPPSHLVWAISVEPHRVRDLIAEQNYGVLWERREPLQLLEG